MKYITCSGAIVAGGLSSRMDGKNKALLTVGDQTILHHQMGVLHSMFEHILLVTNTPMAYASWDMMMVADLFAVRSSLTGIHAALFHAPYSHIFITACDTPFLNKGIVSLLLKNLEPKWDVIVPDTKTGLEPLCAIYSKRCLKPIERHLKTDRPKVTDFFPSVRLKKIGEDLLRQVDPDLLSFFNVNTPQDLTTAEGIWRERRLIP